MAIFILANSFHVTDEFEFVGWNLGKDTDILSALHCKYHYKRILKQYTVSYLSTRNDDFLTE